MSACLKAATTLFQDVLIAFIDARGICETTGWLVLHIKRYQSAVKIRHPHETTDILAIKSTSIKVLYITV